MYLQYLGFDMEIITGWKDAKIRQHSTSTTWQEENSGDIYLSGEFLDKIWTPDVFFGLTNHFFY
jgi:hypothetical protein